LPTIDSSARGIHDLPSSRPEASINPTSSTHKSAAAHTPEQRRSLDHACRCALAADDSRGQDTVVLDLTGVTPIVDFFVIATANSGRQMRAIADAVTQTLRATGSRRIGKEGVDGSTWLLLDYGDIVLHVFSPEARAQYDLEHLWADAPRIDWKHHLAGVGGA
jgi:ribosome-associated protein